AAGLVADQPLRQFFGGTGGEEAGVGIGELVGLPLHRRDDARMLVSEAGDSCAAGGIQYAVTAVGHQPDALAAHCRRRRRAKTAVHYTRAGGAHDGQPFSVTYWEVSDSRASVSSRRRLAPAPPSTKVAAASDCAMAIAPVRLGKNPGEAAASNCSR